MSHNNEKKATIHIGTSGWYYKHWIGQFYPEKIKPKELLEFYALNFQTVELNNTFYRLPKNNTYTTWKNTVSDDFVFTVKANRLITHIKKLQEGEDFLNKFFDGVKILKPNLGPVLFQLPPSWNVNINRLEHFLKKLPLDINYVFEFRNKSWYQAQTYDLLKEYNSAFCIYELEHHITPLIITANFIYIRLHGPGKKYQGSYTDTCLREWAARINKWRDDGKTVYCYFDNDQNAYAPLNALSLIEMIKA